jgi:hypothetical protein
MNTTIKLIESLAASRSADEKEQANRNRKLREEKSRRWGGVLAAFFDYEQANPDSVEIIFPAENIAEEPIVIYLRNPNRRLVLVGGRYGILEGVGPGHFPAICERRNGWPIAAAETTGELVVPALEILADHLNARAISLPEPLAQAA